MKDIFTSSKSDYWNTPKELYNYFINTLKLYDPNEDHDKKNMFYEKIEKQNLYINPPFSQKKLFLMYAINYITIPKNSNNFIVLLLPNTLIGTKLFSNIMKYHNGIMIFINGRLKYNDKGQAPFNSFILIIGDKIDTEGYNTYEIKTVEEIIKNRSSLKYLI